MIIIDADACPNIKLIESLAKIYQIKILICHDTNHIITSDYSEIRIISAGKDSVDTYISNIAKPNDIVITADYGVAISALAKKSYAISPNGFIYNEDNINILMHTRYINNKQRKQGIRVKGPKKRTKKDEEKLIYNLEKLIVKVINK